MITKKTYLLLFLIWGVFSSAQIQIGEGTDYLQSTPFETYYNYSLSQSIYYSTEINAQGTITGLKWYFAGETALANSQGLSIYLGHTSKSSFESTSDWVSAEDLTLVYEGGINVTSGIGWVSITFDTGFIYNGTDHLVIAVKETQSGYDDYDDVFLNSSFDNSRSIVFYSDTEIPNSAMPPVGQITSFVPNIILEGISQSCSAPSELSTTILNSTTATVNWNSEGTQFNVEYGEQGFEQGQGQLISTILSLSTTINTLSSGTAYDFYVQQICDSENSNWSGPFTFQTPCESVSVPYTMNFETSVDLNMPACTTLENAGSGNNWSITSPNITNIGFSAGKKLTYKKHVSSAANTWFYTQGIELTVGESYKLTYRYGQYSYKNEKLRVSYGLSPSHLAMEEELANHIFVPQSSSEINTVVFTPPTTGVYYIGFNAYSLANQYYMYVDDISVVIEGTVPCTTPLPVGDAVQTFNGEITVNDLIVSGENLKWYSNMELTDELSVNTILQDNYTYYVTQTIAGCESAALAITINSTLGTADFENNMFIFYPNPVKSDIHISSAEVITSVELFDISGRKVITLQQQESNKIVLNLSSLSKGIYTLKVKSGNAVKTSKIIKD